MFERMLSSFFFVSMFVLDFILDHTHTHPAIPKDDLLPEEEVQSNGWSLPGTGGRCGGWARRRYAPVECPLDTPSSLSVHCLISQLPGASLCHAGDYHTGERDRVLVSILLMDLRKSKMHGIKNTDNHRK